MPSVAPYQTVIATPQNGDAIATLQAQTYNSKLVGISLTGPADSAFELYLGNLSASARIDVTDRGDTNSNDYSSPHVIPAGNVLIARWPGQAASATACVVTFRVVG